MGALGLVALPLIGLAAAVVLAATARLTAAWATSRRTHPDARPPAGRLARRAVGKALLGAGFGFALTAALATLLLAEYHDEQANDADWGGWAGFGTLILAAFAYLIVVPLASWCGLRLLGIRPAWPAALGAWGLLGGALYLAQHQVPGAHTQPAWFYGLVAAVPYGLAAAAVGGLTPAGAPPRVRRDDPPLE